MKRPVTLVLVASLLVSASAFAGNGMSRELASRMVAKIRTTIPGTATIAAMTTAAAAAMAMTMAVTIAAEIPEPRQRP